MSLLLAVLSSVVLGGADFAGGIAAKRLAASTVVIWSNVAGLLVAVTAAATVVPGQPRLTDVGWGALAGLASSVGATLLYRALATGAMMLAAPVAAVAAALLPVAAGVFVGERLGPGALVGVGLALVALALVSRSGRVGPERLSARTAPSAPAAVTIGLAVAAGLGFGAFMVALSPTPVASGLWPLVFARGTSFGVLLVAARARRRSVRAPVTALTWCWLTGVLDMASSVLYLVAVRDGSLALVGLLASLAPVSTVVLARVVLRERTWLWQRIGAGLAMSSVLLIALG